DRRLLVLAPHVLELLRDLADRAVLLDTLDQVRHEVGVAFGGVAQLCERGERGTAVAGAPDLGEPIELHLAGGLVHLWWREGGRRLVVLVAVQTDDHTFTAVDLALDRRRLV